MAERHNLGGEHRYKSKKYPAHWKKKTVTFQAAEADMLMMDELCDMLGVARGEAIRTSIRVYHLMLKQQLKRN